MIGIRFSSELKPFFGKPSKKAPNFNSVDKKLQAHSAHSSPYGTPAGPDSYSSSCGGSPPSFTPPILSPLSLNNSSRPARSRIPSEENALMGRLQQSMTKMRPSEEAYLARQLENCGSSTPINKSYIPSKPIDIPRDNTTTDASAYTTQAFSTAIENENKPATKDTSIAQWTDEDVALKDRVVAASKAPMSEYSSPNNSYTRTNIYIDWNIIYHRQTSVSGPAKNRKLPKNCN